jgi:hypothetical protein
VRYQPTPSWRFSHSNNHSWRASAAPRLRMAGALLASRFGIPLSRIRIEDSAEPVVRFAIGGRALSAATRGEDLARPTGLSAPSTNAPEVTRLY